ncbi:SDR family oxidoreductase (plasmid) [Cupriavidus pinatubonensis]|uniref:SDR family NAD(P)-dependent oxidoreductase n=1 Tax=Cupriavidus pinatubonensis TaxID=248026 RepID=UPI001C736612|nr:SDR family oxidoreductase [Cupriavidus pinatubonensis]QYY33802.1 SDR family oxidoreductase [Cupriavidus pinatubonensis]
MIFQFEFAGKIVVVTGAFSGLGLHFSRLLAAQGCAVAMCGRRIELGQFLASSIREDGLNAEAFELDVTDASSVESCLSLIREQFGVPHVLVNNAGIVHQSPALDTSDEAWAQTLEVNLTGVWRMTRSFASLVKGAGQPGNVINIASILGLRVAQQVIAYTVCKAGVVQMTKALALELARAGIRVNAIAPGYFETELNQEFFQSDAGTQLVKRIPMRRLGRLDELNGPMLLLASDASSFMNGAVLAVDGGHLVSSL